jgi:hypothetical protein
MPWRWAMANWMPTAFTRSRLCSAWWSGARVAKLESEPWNGWKATQFGSGGDGRGRWSVPLLAAALARNPSLKPGRLEDNVKQPVAFVIEYLDGTRAVAYMLEGQVNAWSFAAKMKDKAERVSTFFEQGDRQGSRPFPHFDELVHCMEEMFVTSKPLYPVERTLLTTCTLAVLFESRAWKKRIETDALKISYRSPRDTHFERA